MLKKAMLGIVAVILLVGAENLIAQERRGRPKAEQEQKGPVEQLRKQRASEEAGRRHVEGMQQRRRQRAVREAEPERVKALQQKQQQKVAKEAEVKKAKAAATRRPIQDVRRKIQQSRPGAILPAQQMAGRWLDELTKAYQENDREKMGQLIRKMHQIRQRVRKARGAPGEAGRDFRGRPGAAQPGAKKERPEIRKAPPEDVVRPLMPGRGMRGWGQGFQGRGMGRRGQGMQGRGMMMQRRGMMMQRRGMGRPEPGMPAPAVMEKPGPPMPPEDMDRTIVPMPRRGMRGWGRGFQGRGMGQGFPGPWCPWLRVPGPETD